MGAEASGRRCDEEDGEKKRRQVDDGGEMEMIEFRAQGAQYMWEYAKSIER